jgi:hypothetical protein
VERAVPVAILDHLRESVTRHWSSRDVPPPLGDLPAAMPEGVVMRLTSGGPFGWLLDARLDEVDGRLALEVLEDSRMAGPDHYRVWDDGTVEQLESVWTAYATPAGATDDERRAIEERYYAHNRAVGEALRARGFLGG